MTSQWAALEDSLQSAEDDNILQALTQIHEKCTDNKPLENGAGSALFLQVIDKLQHHDIAVRYHAIAIIASQLRASNWTLESLMPELAKKIAQPNILDLKASKKANKKYKKLHKEVVYAITEIHNRHPSKILPVFKPVVNYMVDCTGSSEREVSTAACQFWGYLKTPPVTQKGMGEWLPPVFQKLGKLVQNLLKAMIYHEDYVQYLESQVNAGARPRTKSLEFESLSDLRNYAALGFEKICAIFTSEVTPIFKLYLQKWLSSNDWLEQEAVTLALGAYCQAMQGPQELKDLSPYIMSQLLAFYQSDRPLLRAITCFSMPHFMNVRAKGVKDPFGRMLRSTLSLVNDSNCEVQDQAMRSMATLMAYGERDFSSHSRKIVKALVNANYTAVGKCRHAYYECIGHTFGRLGTMLDEKDAHALIDPVMENWNMLQWGQLEQAPLEDIKALCSPLCVIAIFSKNNFAQYNEQILDKVMPYLEKISSGEGQVDLKSDAITTHMVAYIDIISAMYDGQGARLARITSKLNLLDVLITVLQNQTKFQDEVTQSTLALLGHMNKNNVDDIKQHLDEVVTSLSGNIDSKSDNVRSNALWCLIQLIKACDEKNQTLLQLSKDLTDMILNVQGEENVVVNASLALTMMAGKWSGSVVKVVLREEVFVHLCALLQTSFSVDDDKQQLIHYLCLTIANNMNKVPKDAWIHFCAAAAILDVPNDQTRDEIKNILKDVRTTVGNAAWNKLNTKLGQKMAYNMRKKYKLY